MEKLLDVRDLKVEYRTEERTSYAVKGVSFSMEKGEILGIVGESGSGKSTLGLALMALLPSYAHYTGEVIFQGKDLVPMSFDELRQLKGDELSVVFQEPMTSLNPLVRIGKQVEEMLTLHARDKDRKEAGIRMLSKEERKAKVLEMLEAVEIPEPEKAYKKYPHELSGGQQQRVMIAMALMCEPQLLIADEPTTALDADVQDQVLELLKKINKERGTSIILVSHDLRVIHKVCNRTLVMYKGEIVEQGTVEEIFEHPKDPYTQSLIAAITDERKGGKEIVSDPALEVKDLTVFYMQKTNKLGEKPKKKVIVEHMDFEVKKGEILGLVGKSGSGKSTISRAILGLHKDYTGEIIHHTKRPQMIFQDSSGSLNPARKIGWILEGPLRNQTKYWKQQKQKNPELDISKYILSPAERKQRVREMLQKVELDPDKYLDRYPRQLSGGQKQRVNIALALMSGSKFVIADEPVSALDVSIQEQILELLLGLQKDLNLSMLFISHDQNVVARICDRVIYMEEWTPRG
ncbi:MAG: ABC transporter ATP-binding protein [Parasporobacterium sp.]|nr:ABC transporter ATP-binding protein [Parasporobacterium sp.]